MKYSLSNDVYLVSGHARSCLYDLNKGKLYSISNTLAEKLEMISASPKDIVSNDKELLEAINKLLAYGLLTRNYKSKRTSILDIASKESKIDMAWIEITNKCNMKCLHCYNESNAHCNNEMTLDNYKIVIDSIEKLGVQKVQIIGGEPFIIRNKLKEMLLYTINKFKQIEIFTNGTLITDEWFDFLRDHHIRIALSVYSYLPEMHDKVTGSFGSWEKTNETIEKLHNHGIEYRVCNILMEGVALGERNTLLYELSPDKDIVRMSGRANIHLLTDELIEKKLITKETFRAPISKEFCRRLISGHNCYNSRIYISSMLEVFPCVMERRLKHCTIDEQRTIFLDSSILKMNKNHIEGCRMCEYRYACFDCRPNSLSGDIFEKPWYCTYDPNTGIWENKSDFISQLKKSCKL